MSFDPIGEKGGFNLYCMVGNNPVGNWDHLGEKSLTDHALDKMKELYENHEHEVGSQYSGDVPAGAKKTDCITYVLNVLEYAYEKIGKKDIAKKIWSYGKKGTALAKYLQTLGWKAVYWNPDVRNPRDWNSTGKKWEEHPYSYHIAKTKKTYYDLTLTTPHIVNYKVTDISTTPSRYKTETKQETLSYRKLLRVKFGYGLARGGMHTFLYGSGYIYEVHWDKIGDDLYEKVMFRNYGWLSGVILLPPDNGQF